MIRALAPLAAALIVFAAACSTDDDGGDEPTVVIDGTPQATAPSTSTASCEPGFSAAPGDTPGAVTSGGIERTYLLHIPSSYNGTRPAPLIVVYHGFGSTAQSIADYTRFNALADEEGFVVAYPNALGVPTIWNDDGDITIADDVQFAADLVTKLQSDVCLDAARVYAVGWSNGGGMAQRVGCELPEVFAAVGTVSATYSDCKAPMPWIAFHGTADPQVPYEGGANTTGDGGGPFLPTRRVLSEYARELGCDALGQISRPASEIELTTYVRCQAGDGLVLLYTLLGGGHTWPGAAALPLDIFGPTNNQIDATRAIWDFFVEMAGESATDSADPSVAD